jgi:hypothetical protein
MTEHSAPLAAPLAPPVSASDSAVPARCPCDLGGGVSVAFTAPHVVVTTSTGQALTLDPDAVRTLRRWFRHVVDHERGDAE